MRAGKMQPTSITCHFPNSILERETHLQKQGNAFNVLFAGEAREAIIPAAGGAADALIPLLHTEAEGTQGGAKRATASAGTEPLRMQPSLPGAATAVHPVLNGGGAVCNEQCLIKVQDES